MLGKDSKDIQTDLEHGVPLEEILVKQGNGRFYEHLQFFLRITSLHTAIDSALRLYDFERTLLVTFVKKAAYPFCMFLFAYVLLLIFSTSIIPQMLNSFDQGEDFQGLLLLIALIQGICRMLALISILGLGMLLYLKHHPHIRTAWILKSKKLCALASHVQSYLFSGYMIELLKQGISTRVAFQYLQQVRKDTLFAMLMRRITKRLQEGVDVLTIIEEEVLLNEAFTMSFRIGSSCGTLCAMLQSNLKQQERIWEQLLKKAVIAIQCLAYSFVGIVVLLVYQVMLIPLSMLEQM